MAMLPFAFDYIKLCGVNDEARIRFTQSQYRTLIRAQRVLNAFSHQLLSDSPAGTVDVSMVLKLVNECGFCASMLKKWNDAAKKHNL
ncbi:MAG: hypothetical protein HYS08_10675 [Chlamydiae bacterium]|nr:hypothetical protein [Chlamydiota bacterium]